MREKIDHYTQGKIECIDYISDKGWMVPFCLGNIVKYATRFEHKGDPLEDIEKIINYAEMLLEYMTWDVEEHKK
jgi:hypothetical protein